MFSNSDNSGWQHCEIISFEFELCVVCGLQLFVCKSGSISVICRKTGFKIRQQHVSISS